LILGLMPICTGRFGCMAKNSFPRKSDSQWRRNKYGGNRICMQNNLSISELLSDWHFIQYYWQYENNQYK
jgi:hypothetical protein